MAFECGTQKRMETQTDTRNIDSDSRSSLLTLSQKVHGSFAFLALFWKSRGTFERTTRWHWNMGPIRDTWFLSYRIMETQTDITKIDSDSLILDLHC